MNFPTIIPEQRYQNNEHWQIFFECVVYIFIYLFVLFVCFCFRFCGGRGGGEGIINISIIKYKHEITIMKQRKASKY